MRWLPAYVALGSNLADPARQVLAAFEHLSRVPETRLLARSRLYRTRPMGPRDQPDFINAAAGLLTRLPAESLLARLKEIEALMGRTPLTQRWGPRLIDLDLLVYAAQVRSGALLLPHPGIHERNFVLYPLAEIAPELYVPGHGPVAELARRVSSDGVQPINA
jgi:2-amino-4-hydroxy-6-hydroxymethyldihydropteridine diphosphokinase